MRILPLSSSSRSFCTAAVCLLVPLVSRATSIQTNAPAITASPGSTGKFEEFITNAVNATGEIVTGFSFTLSSTAVAASGLSFTDASMATTPDAYIFQGVSADAQNGTALSPSTFPTTSFTAADSDTNSAGITLVGGVNYALVEVSYAVASNATPGIYTITPSITLSGTGSLGVFPTAATITIVPEPSTWAMLAGGGITLGMAALRRRHARR